MISLDTNLILAALDPLDALHERAIAFLESVEDPFFYICPPVYAELRAGEGLPLVEAFLQSLSVRLHLEMPLEVWRPAGERFGLYARKRREGGLPRRILADFLIGAHAFYHGLRLATFDPLPYHTAFPELEVLP